MTPNSAEPDYFSQQVEGAQRFYRQPGQGDSRDINVVSGGREICSSVYKIYRESFPYFCFEYVAAGRGDLVLGGIASALYPGAIFSYGPHISHSIRNNQDAPLVKHFVCFEGEKAATLIAENPILSGVLLYTSSPISILNSYEELLQYGLTNTANSHRMCCIIIELLLLKILETAVPWKESESRAFTTYQRCHEIIRSNFLKLHSLAEIAETCNINPSYLCRLYQKYDSQTPYRQLMRLQMNHAADQLSFSGKLVQDVAGEMGFSDPFHFSRTFKRFLGISPTQVKQY